MTASLAWKAALLLSAAALGIYIAGCKELFAPPGNWVDCTITGQALGSDGEALRGVDIAWFADDDTGYSINIEASSASSFEVTRLNLGPNATRVQGVLSIGEVAQAPFPVMHDPLLIPIDLPLDSCQEQLGALPLPPLGEGQDRVGEE